MQFQQITHEFQPLYNGDSRILILGSFPSVKSREQQFYYGHTRNRFWKVISTLLHENTPQTIEEKKQLLLSHHIALWDVIWQCDIVGSSDASITNVIPNDISRILDSCPIQAIFTNGTKAHELYKKWIYPMCKIEDIKLPSTSPANAAFRLDNLLEHWQCILQYL